MADYTENWDVIVGNIGTVYSGPDEGEARRRFAGYVDQSKSAVGRAGGESVTLLHCDEIADEFVGAVDSE